MNAASPRPSGPADAQPRIAFVGAGATGGYVGAHLFQAGYDVTLIDPWPEHVEAIRKNGLAFSGTVGEYTIAVPALHIHEAQQVASRSPVDIAFVCTKLYDTAWAASLAGACLAPGGYVVTLQNCLVEELVAGIVGADRTLGCIASTLSAEAHRPGGIVRTRQPGGSGYTIFRAGELHGRTTPRLQALVAMLGQVDSARATSNLWGERWSKLVANTMTTALSASTGLTLKSIVAGAPTRSIMIRLAAEAIRIGVALGYALEPIRTLDAQAWLDCAAGDAAARAAVDAAFDNELKRMTDRGYSGMAQDLRKGRRTENDFMNGYVARRGREAGLPAPTHEALSLLIGRIERGAAAMDPAHLDTLVDAVA